MDELRESIKEARLSLHYQPRIFLNTGEVAGWEALARWKHPDGRLVVPDEFIPIAEETGNAGP